MSVAILYILYSYTIYIFSGMGGWWDNEIRLPRTDLTASRLYVPAPKTANNCAARLAGWLASTRLKCSVPRPASEQHSAGPVSTQKPHESITIQPAAVSARQEKLCFLLCTTIVAEQLTLIDIMLDNTITNKYRINLRYFAFFVCLLTNKFHEL